MDLKVKELKPKVHQQSLIKLNQTVAQNSHITFDASEICRSPVDILIYGKYPDFSYSDMVFHTSKRWLGFLKHQL